MIEEYHFWTTKKTMFVVKLSAAVFVSLIAMVGISAWMLYHEKANESQVDTKQQSQPAAAAFDNNPDSTNTAASSLSPLPPQPNSN